jgi:hypothetical protein
MQLLRNGDKMPAWLPLGYKSSRGEQISNGQSLMDRLRLPPNTPVRDGFEQVEMTRRFICIISEGGRREKGLSL